MENKEHITNLFRKYLAQQYTEVELDEILQYFQLPEHDEFLTQLIEQELDKNSNHNTSLIKSIGEEVARNLFIQTRPKTRSRFKQWLPYAAAVLLFFATGLVLYYTQFKNRNDTILATEDVILPGSNRATITLGNGQVLTLSGAHKGVINTGETLTYVDGTPIESLEGIQLVTLTTPRAGQYAVTLSDGTRVWLNAASELIYPTRFDGNERQVWVKGEAFFEVEHDKNKPFIVHANQQKVQVLGTKFNVYAYPDEIVQHTTLVEGAVLVSGKGNEQRLRLSPGQQAISKAEEGLSIISVNPREYTSWKDGIIQLNGYELSEILRQLERWYDVEFGEIPIGIESDRLFGMIRRDVPLNDVLQTLRDNYTTIQFKINGRRIMMSSQ